MVKIRSQKDILNKTVVLPMRPSLVKTTAAFEAKKHSVSKIDIPFGSGLATERTKQNNNSDLLPMTLDKPKKFKNPYLQRNELKNLTRL